MLEDRIIVQDRGIDAGLAALMQNANKGSMDPTALLAMMNNNGLGGNGGWWWIWIILLFFCWGGNGFGFGNRNAGALASELNTDANTNLLMQAINGNKEAISTLSTTLNCDINSVQTALNTINTGVSQIACDTKLASCEVINAITSGNASLASQLASCCCDVRSSLRWVTKVSYLCVTRLIHCRVLSLLDLTVCYPTILLSSIFLVLRLMHKLRLSMISSVNLKCAKCRIRLTLFVKKIINQLCLLPSRLKQLIQ